MGDKRGRKKYAEQKQRKIKGCKKDFYVNSEVENKNTS